MKTREEMLAAIDEIVREAEASGFTFIAAIDSREITTIAATGNKMTRLGMAHVMCHLLSKDCKVA